jgi:hypothetical protein
MFRCIYKAILRLQPKSCFFWYTIGSVLEIRGLIYIKIRDTELWNTMEIVRNLLQCMEPYLCNLVTHGTLSCDQADNHYTWNSAIK